MNESKSPSTVISFQSIAPWLLVTFLGMASIKPFLSSDRPMQFSKPESSELGKSGSTEYKPEYQPMKVRLWQDPLFGIQTLRRSSQSVQQGVRTVRKLLENTPTEGKGADRLLFIFSYATDGNDGEAIESRRGERFACISALANAGYAPESPDKMHMVRFQLHKNDTESMHGQPVKAPEQDVALRTPSATSSTSEKESENRASGSFRIAPYEWFKAIPKDGKTIQAYKGVCVIWIDSLATPNDRFNCVLRLMDNLRDEYEKIYASSTKQRLPYQFIIAGKVGSGEARGMAEYLKELQTDKQSEVTSDGSTTGDMTRAKARSVLSRLSKDQLQIVATHSTVGSLRKDINLFQATPRYYSCGGIPFFFPMGTDDQLAQLLRKEIDSRYLRPWDLDQSIGVALFAEADTEYGRKMIQTYETAFSSDSPRKYDVVPHSYLQGLDGIAPSAPKDAGEPKEKSLNATLPTASFAEGDRQFDHIQRIALEMKMRPKKYRAIGVLGSDTYDKLLLLKVLRPMFPDAIFFTTDIDARFLQPGDWAHTHNLLIASHYGLSLDEKWQKNTAPFRYVYDTASYLTYLWSVQHESKGIESEWEEIMKAVRDDKVPERFARVYEVGRYGAVPLNFCDEHINDFKKDDIRTKDARAGWGLSFLESVSVILFLLISLVLLYIFSRDFRRLLGVQNQYAQEWLRFLSIVCVAVFVLLFAIYHSHYAMFGEPFTLFEGISVWPTNLLRFFAICLCGYLLFFRIRAELDKSRTILLRYLDTKTRTEIESDYDKPKPKQWGSIGWWHQQWETSKTYWLQGWPNHAMNDTEAKIIPLNQLVVDVLQYGRWSNRIARTTFLFLLNFTMVICLIYVFGYTVTPARGLTAHFTSILLFLVSEPVTLLFLLMFVVDTTILTYRFIAAATDERVDYESSSHLLETMPQWAGNKNKSQALDQLKRRIHILRLRVQLIADSTSDVTKMIQYPFWVLAILLVSHAPIFDNWHWTTTQIIMACLSVGAAVICAYSLQSKAKTARRKVIEELDQMLLPFPLPKSTLPTDKQLPTGELRDYIMETRKAIDGLDSGAFRPLVQSSLALAVLWLVLGFIAPELVDMIKPLINRF